MNRSFSIFWVFELSIIMVSVYDLEKEMHLFLLELIKVSSTANTVFFNNVTVVFFCGDYILSNHSVTAFYEKQTFEKSAG